MKKFLIVLLAILVINVPIYGSQKEIGEKSSMKLTKQDELNISKVKKIFDLSHYDKFEFSRYDSESTTTNYSWINKGEGIDVEFNKYGDIVSIGNYFNRENSKNILKTKEELKKFSDEFVKKIDEKFLQDYKINDININLINSTGIVTYDRYINGIKLLNSQVRVIVDLRESKVTEFLRNSIIRFNDVKIADKSKIISKEEAIKILNDDNPLRKAYLIYDDNGTKKAMPVFATVEPIKYVNAITKQILRPNYYAKDAKAEAAQPDFNLSEIEKKEFDKVSGLKDFDEVNKFILNNFDLKGYKLKNKSIYSNSGNYYYQINYERDKKTKLFEINAKDLEITNYQNYAGGKFDKSKFKKDEAIKVATDFAKKYSKKTDIDFKNPRVIITEYNAKIVFDRIKNESIVLGNGIEVAFDKNSSVISSYKLDYDDVKFEKFNDAIKIEKAHDLIFGENIALFYKNSGDLDLVYGNKIEEECVVTEDGRLINKFTLEEVNKNFDYPDLEKSKYKDKIEYLNSIGIGIKDRSLKDEITAKEFLKFMEDLNYSYGNGNFKLTGDKIKNKDAIKFIVKQKVNLDNFKNIFNNSEFKDYKDISKEYLPYYYFAKGMGIYTEKYAQPEKILTVEDVLILGYNIINIEG